MSNSSDTNVREEVGRQLSFALYSASNRIIRMHKPFLDPLGLTYPQFLVLLALYAGTPRTVGELGQELGMDYGTLPPLLKRLQGAGLVTRVRDSQDERRVLIDLTDAGEALREAVSAIPKKLDAACRVTPDELAQLRDSLNALGTGAGMPNSEQDHEPTVD